MDENINNMMNYNGMNANLYNNQNYYNAVPEKPKRNIWIILITILVAVATVYGKIRTFGWLTLMGTWSMIMPLHCIFFIIDGIKFSGKKEKKKSDYNIFASMCITNLLYAFLFVDAGDNERGTFFYNLSDEVLDVFFGISMVCFLISSALIIVLFSRCSKKKKTNQIVYNQQNMYQQPNGQQNYYQQQIQQNNIQNYYNTPTEKTKRNVWIILITIIVAVATIFGKLRTFGWITILGIWSTIMPLHCIFLIMSGINFSGKKEKKISDFITFFIMCITSLLYAFLFVDYGDGVNDRGTFFNNVSDDLLGKFLDISLICFLISCVSIIVLSSKCGKKKKINQNVYGQQNMYQQQNGQQNYYQQPNQQQNYYQQPNQVNNLDQQPNQVNNLDQQPNQVNNLNQQQSQQPNDK